MRNLGNLAVAALVLGGLAAGGAAAQEAPSRGGPFHAGPAGLEFEAIDADGDGTITRAELTSRATERLAEVDVNADGVIGRAEIVAVVPDRPGAALTRPFGRDPGEVRADRMLEWMDAGEAGQFEVSALVERQINGLLAVADTDRDGAISEEEADGMQDRFAERMRGHHDRDDHRRGPRRF